MHRNEELSRKEAMGLGASRREGMGCDRWAGFPCNYFYVLRKTGSKAVNWAWGGLTRAGGVKQSSYRGSKKWNIGLHCLMCFYNVFVNILLRIFALVFTECSACSFWLGFVILTSLKLLGDLPSQGYGTFWIKLQLTATHMYW